MTLDGEDRKKLTHSSNSTPKAICGNILPQISKPNLPSTGDAVSNQLAPTFE